MCPRGNISQKEQKDSQGTCKFYAKIKTQTGSVDHEKGKCAKHRKSRVVYVLRSSWNKSDYGSQFYLPTTGLKSSGLPLRFRVARFLQLQRWQEIEIAGMVFTFYYFPLFPLKVTWGLAHSSQGRPRTRAFVTIKIYLVVIKASLILDKIRLNIPFNFAITWPFHLFEWAPYGSGTWQNILDKNSWVLDNQI